MGVPGIDAKELAAHNKLKVARAKTALRAWIPPDTDGFDINHLETDILGLMIDLLVFAKHKKMDTKELLDLVVTNFEME